MHEHENVETLWLRRQASHRVAGLACGVLSVNPDPGDPAALVGVYDEATGERVQVVLRPQEPVAALGRTLTALQVDGAGRAAVLLTVAPPGSEPGGGTGPAEASVALSRNASRGGSGTGSDHDSGDGRDR